MSQQKILLIEDDELIRDLYVRQFAQAGLLAEGVANGRTGLETAFKGGYSLILLDIMLPDINGLEILKKLKEYPQTQKIPVVLLSNLGQDEIVKQGFNLGAEGYLIKLQYTPEQVIQEVKNILSRKSGS